MSSSKHRGLWLIVLFAATFTISGSVLIENYYRANSEREQFEKLRQPSEVTLAETAVMENTSPFAATAQEPSEPIMLPYMADLYEQNPDIAGWIRIDGTKIDYPVMSTPDEPHKYLNLGFDRQYSKSGIPFIGGMITDDNLVIHGHNMKNGTMFSALLDYAQQDFWDTHKIINFDTLYERREYEVIAVFRTRAFSPNEDGFRYHRYTDFESEADFNIFLKQVQAAALYDTGVTAKYGDALITLSTCSYHEQDGRFVVVARIV